MTRLHVHTSFAQPPPPWFKGKQSTRRDPDEVTAWCWHQTDVEGGYGAADLEARCERYAGTSDAKPGVPYHYVYSPQDDALIALWSPELYSYHGNGVNAYSLGISIDGKYPGDDLDIGALAEAFALAIEHAAGQGFSPAELDAHRQHSDGRGGDPGELVWPVVETVALEWSIAPTITRTSGTGKPIPDSWRPQGSQPAPQPPATGSTADQVTAMQGQLASWGHDPGAADGLWGPNSQAALDSWVASVD